MDKSNVFKEIRSNYMERLQKSYSEENYIETIALIHVILDYQLKNYLFLKLYLNQIKETPQNEKLIDITRKELLSKSFSQILFYSHLTHTISDGEYEELIEFNELRNRIIHKIFTSELNKEDIEEAYAIAMKYLEMFSLKVADEFISL